MHLKKKGVRLLIAVLFSSCMVTPVFAAPSIGELQQSRSQKQSEVSSLQEELTEILGKLGDLENDLIQTGEAITKAEADLKDAEAKEKQQYEDMKVRIKFMYESGGAVSAMESILTSESFADLVNQAEYISHVHQYDREQFQEYVDTKNEIVELKAKLEKDKKELEEKQSEYEAKESELQDMITSKRSEIVNLDAQIQAAAEEAARQAQEEAARRAALAARQAAVTHTDPAQQPAAPSSTVSSVQSPSSSTTVISGSGSTAAAKPAETPAPSGGQTNQNTSVAQMIVDAAYGQRGVPYVWGGTTPGQGLDCSGLTQYCHAVAGISIPRTSEVQGGGGMAVSDPLPGDLVCYGSHIGIYIGNGQMIHAPHTGDVVRVANVYGSPWYRRYW